MKAETHIVDGASISNTYRLAGRLRICVWKASLLLHAIPRDKPPVFMTHVYRRGVEWYEITRTEAAQMLWQSRGQ